MIFNRLGDTQSHLSCQKVDDLTVWDHAIRQRAAKAACAVWAYLVPLARSTLFPAWAQRAFSFAARIQRRNEAANEFLQVQLAGA